MTNTARNGVIGLVAIAVIVVGGYYAFARSAAPSGNVAPVEGSVSQADLDRATVSLKSAINAAGGEGFNFQAQPTYGHYANFGIVQQVNEVKSVGLVDEMAVTFRGKTDNENAEVDPKTAQVVSFHREISEGGSAKTQAEIEATVRAFLKEVYPNFAQIEPSLTFDPGMKGVRLNNGNYFFRWNDDTFKLPDGLSADLQPFVQVSITANGYIFGYNNTIDLYRNALKEFNLTQ